jgi:Ser/Thr protein kinase RdoA (MazF antagonist)
MQISAPAVAVEELARWCARNLGSAAVGEVFRSGYLATVVGLRLEDGREVVVKVRRRDSRQGACIQVQRAVALAGFPCPSPLTGILAFGENVAHAEAFIPGGDPVPRSTRDAKLFARAFAWLLRSAADSVEVAALVPAPSWVAWNHDGEALWPLLEDYDVDLNLVDGPRWCDDVARAARERLSTTADNPIIGHADFYAGNIRWHGDELLVVHDWDSVVADSEAALVGYAAAVYPTLHAGDESTIAESEAFLDAYQAERVEAFTPDEVERSWAAGVWLRTFDAKKQFAVGQPVRSMTENEARSRLRYAGTPVP